MGDSDRTAPEPIVVALHSKRRRKALALQKLNHAVPACGLLLAGKQAIAEGGHGLGFYLGIFEIASAAALIVLTARELRGALPTPAHATGVSASRPKADGRPLFSRKKRGCPFSAAHAAPHARHHGIDWVDIAAGFVLLAETLEHWHVTGHVQRPTVLTAVVTFALGLTHGRIKGRTRQRRVLRMDDQGIVIAGRPFKARRLEAKWSDVRSVEVGPRWAVVTTRAGQVRRLDLPDLETEPAARAALAEACRRIPADPPLQTAQ